MADARPDLGRYAEAARRVDAGDACACGRRGPFGAGHYDDLAGLPDAAVQVSLGCGNPVAVADLRPGDTVLDLGSGGGIDVLLSARRVGPTGFAYGLDATVEMVDLARRNAADAGATNVEFLHGSHRGRPAARRLRRRRHLELRHRAVRRQGRHVRRDRPGPAAGRPGRDQRHRARRARRRHTRPASPAATPPSRIDAYEDALRRAGLATVTIELTDPIGAGLSNAIIRARKPSVTIRPMTRRRLAGRPRTSTPPGSPPATPRSRPPRRPGSAGTPATSTTTASSPPTTTAPWSAGPRSAPCRTAASTPASPRTASTSTPTTGPRRRHQLLDALVAGAERAGYWTIQTGIFPENTASIAAHERVGFRIVGRRERIGQLDGVWRDTLLLERRSTRI